MKTKTISIFILMCLLFTSCQTFDVSGLATSNEAWIDAPLDEATVRLGQIVAIMGHTNFAIDQMFLLINGTPLIELAVREVGGGLWEGTGTWTPIASGEYKLRVFGKGDDQIDSNEIVIYVLESVSEPMMYITPTPSSTPAITPAATSTTMPPAQVNFWSDSYSIVRGGCTLLHWQANYVTNVLLNGEIVAQLGDRQVCPEATTTYFLRAEAPGGNLEQQLIVTVILPSPTAKPPTATTRPPTAVPPSPTTPPDNTGPSVTNLSHSPDAIWDGSSCGAISAEITAKASDPSGISKVEVYYRVVKGGTQGAWRMKTMNKSGGKTYQTNLGYADLQTSLVTYGGGIVEYYVRAWDNLGNLTQSNSQSFEVKVCLT